MRFLVVLVALLLPSAVARADVRCTPTTSPEAQYRATVKHRQPPATPTLTDVTVADMVAWPLPPHSEDVATRTQDAEVDPREGQAFRLDGDAWRIRLEDNDCDLHMEIAAHGAEALAPRIIVEIPAGAAFVAARDALLAAAGHLSARDRRTPLHVVVEGFAFWDGHHWTARDPVRGHNHGSRAVGTLWELHPVWRVAPASELVPTNPF